jgi:hypothetical protein
MKGAREQLRCPECLRLFEIRLVSIHGGFAKLTKMILAGGAE